MSEPVLSQEVSVSSIAGTRRLAIVAALLVCQALLVKFGLHPRTPEYDGRYRLLGEMLVPATYFVLGFSLMLSTHFAAFFHGLLAHQQGHASARYLVAQFACYGCMIFAAGHLMPSELMTFTGGTRAQESLWIILLAVSVTGTVLFSLLVLAPARYWRFFARTEKTPLFLALAFSVLAYAVGTLTQRSWNVLGSPTMHLSHWLLQWVFSDVEADFTLAQLGTSRFGVTVNYQCSGYEGIGMMLVFLTWYLYAFKAELRFPNALLLVPAGMLLIWLANGVRIAMLIAIGSLVSPEVAMQGFHSNAGWISFTVIALGFAHVASNSSFFSSRSTEGRRLTIDEDTACVLPMLVLLATTLVSGAFSSDFPWLYPLRVLAAGASVLLLWRYFRFVDIRLRLFPIIAGGAVFLLWIFLIDADPRKSQSFAASLFSVPAAVYVPWIAFRCIGAAVVVPIVEELAFRRYVFTLFGAAAGAESNARAIPWLPVLASSLMFGALHQAWFAGTIAGLAYYFVMRGSGKLWDAVLAHATTNSLICVYVFASGNWSYW